MMIVSFFFQHFRTNLMFYIKKKKMNSCESGSLIELSYKVVGKMENVDFCMGFVKNEKKKRNINEQR